MWSNKYLGIPYKSGGRDENGIDCWGLARLIYKNEYDIELPSFDGSYIEDDRERSEQLIAQYREGWEDSTPEEGCVVLLRVMGHLSHIGVMVNDKQFIHAQEGSGSSLQTIDGTKWKNRVAGYFKYRENAGVVLNAVPHPLKTERVTLNISPGTTLEELYSKVKQTVVVPQALEKIIHIFVNGILIPRVSWAVTVLKSSDVVEYRSVPQKEAGRLILTLVVTYIAYQIAGPAGGEAAFSAMGGVSGGSAAVTAAQVGYYAAATATLVVGTALVNSILPIRAPEDRDPGSSEAQYIVGGGQNSYSPYGAIPVVLGKIRMTPPLLSKTFVTFEDVPGDQAGTTKNISYMSGALCWGYGPVSVDESTLKIGSTDWTSYENIDKVLVSYQSGQPSGATREAFEKIVASDVEQKFSGLQLPYSLDAFKALQNPDGTAAEKVTESEFLALQTSSPGTYYMRYEDIGGTAVGAIYRTTWDSYKKTTYRQDNETTIADIETQTRATVYVTSPGGWTESGKFNQPLQKVVVAISFPQGLRLIKIKGGDSGKTFETTAAFAIEYRYKVDNINWSTTWTPLNPIQVTKNEKDGFTFTRTYDLDSTKLGVEFRIKRTSSDNSEPNDEERITSSSILHSFTGYYTDPQYSPVDWGPTTPDDAKIAKMAFRVKATDQLNGNLDGISAEVQSICKLWNNSGWTGSAIATSNPAALFLHILTHPGNPQRVLSAELANKVNLSQLTYWYNYCQNYKIKTFAGNFVIGRTYTVLKTGNTNWASVGGTGVVGSTFVATGSGTYSLGAGVAETPVPLEYNGVVTNQRSVLEVLRDICAAGRASPALLDGRWTVNIDEVKPFVVQHFTPHNSWGFESIKGLPKFPDAFKIQFFDQDSNYQENEVILPSKDVSAETAVLFESIPLPGITNKLLVEDFARWHYAQIKLRPEIFTLNTDIEYLVCNRGDRVKVLHDVPMWGLQSGRVKTDLAVDLFELDEQVPIEQGVNYTIRFRTVDENQTNESKVQSLERQLKTTFIANTYRTQNRFITLTFDPSYSAGRHPFVVDQIVEVITTATGAAHTNAVITAITSNSITYEAAPGVLQPAAAGTPISATVKYKNGYYSRIMTTSSAELVVKGDLFMQGKLEQETQDLVVLGIEPTSGAKNARLTLVDYGVQEAIPGVVSEEDAYNIFNDYYDYTSLAYFSNITDTPFLQSDSIGDKKPFILVDGIISDERVMIKASATTFILNINVPFLADLTLPKTVTTVEGQIDIGTELSASYKYYRTEIDKSSLLFTDVEEEKTYRFRARYLDKDGVPGMWTDWVSHEVVGKRNPPESVTNLDFLVLPGAVKFTWDNCAAPDYKYTVIKDVTGIANPSQDWSSGITLFEGPLNSFTWPEAVDGEYVIGARHMDHNNILSTVVTTLSLDYTAIELATIRVELSNDNHQVPANFDGSAPNLLFSGTEVSVYQGGTLIGYDGIGTGNGKWRIESIDEDFLTAGALQPVIDSVNGDPAAVLNDLTDFIADLGTVKFNIVGRGLTGIPFTISKTQRLIKVKNGQNAVLYRILTDTKVVYKNSPNKTVAGPFNEIKAIGKKYDGSTASNFGWLGVTPYIDSTAGTEARIQSGSTADNVIFSPSPSDLTTKFIIRLYETETSTTVLDIEELQVVFKGSIGISNALIYAYKRAQNVVTDNPGTVVYDFVNKQIVTNPLQNGWSASIPEGEYPLYVTIASASTDNLAGTDTVASTEWSTPVIYAENGVNSATVYLYARNNSTTTAPVFTRVSGDTSTSSAYDFVSKNLSGFPPGVTPNYWSDAIPSEENGKVVWIRSATAANVTSIDYIPDSEWSDPQVLSGIAKGLFLTASSYIFRRNAKNNNIPDQTIKFTALKQNTVNGVKWSTNPTVPLYQAASGGSPIAQNSFEVDEVYMRVADFGSNTSVAVTANVPEDALLDTTIVSAVRDGGSGITVELSNPVHQLQTTNLGVVTYTGSGTSIKVLEGDEYVVITSVNIVGLNIDTPGQVTSGLTTNTVNISDHNTINGNNGSVIYTISFTRLDGSPGNVVAVQKLSRNIQGNNGKDALNIVLSNESHTIPAETDGTPLTYTGAITTATVYNGTVDDSINWTFTVTPSNASNIDYTLSNSNRTVTITDIADTSDSEYVDIVATRTGFASLTARFSLSKSKTGKSGVTINLSNDSHVLFATTAGVVSDYSGATTTVKILLGGVEDTDNGWSFATSPASTAGFTYTGGGTKTISVTNMTADSAFVDITATKTGYSPLVSRFSLSKSKTGSTGATGNTQERVELYLATTDGSTPTAPTSVLYTITGAVLGTLTGGTAGWSLSMPAAPVYPGAVFMTTATAVTTTPNTQITLTGWTTPVVVAKNPQAGTDGKVVYAATVYRQVATQPTAPTGGNFNAVTGAVAAPTSPDVWLSTQPTTTTTPTWASNYVFVVNQGSTTNTGGTWSTPYIEAVKGDTGASGNTQERVELYYSSSTGSVPTQPTNALYTVSGAVLGTITGGDSPWTLTMPSTPAHPGAVYMTTAVASTATPATQLTVTGWTTPVVVAKNGAAGGPGADGKVVYSATVYRQVATPGSAPTGGNFNASTAVVTPPTGSLGEVWVVSQPATTTTPTWASDYTFVVNQGSTTNTGGTWSTPYIEAVKGDTGATGNTQQKVELYLSVANASNVPTVPTSIVYTVTGSIVGAQTDGTAGWSNTKPAIPAAPGAVFMTSATASTNTPGTAITLTGWTTAVIVARNGSTGATGISIAKVYIKTTDQGTPPATPTSTANPPTTPATWSTTPVSLTGTEAQWESDGTSVNGTTWTWSTPYLSYFKVNTLQAITTSTGSLNITGTMKSGADLVNNSPAISGTALTGSGAIIYNDGKFGFGNATNYVTWNGTTLTINGTISATSTIDGTAASTVKTGAASGASSLQPGTAANDVNTNTTTISGSKIRAGSLLSNNHSGVADGSAFATAGMAIDLVNGAISAKNFRISSTGDAVFAGQITVSGTNYNTTDFLNSNTTAANVGLGNVSNLSPQNQAQSGLTSGVTITGGGITLNGGGSIKAGQTAYDTGTGFFLGFSGANPNFSIGNSAGNKLTWDTASGVLTITGTLSATSIIGSTTASTVVSNAAAVTTKLNKSAADTLSGTIDFTSSGGFKTGTVTIATDGTASGSGVAISSKGIIGLNAGVATFSINATTGAAVFKGDITGASGTFGGNLDVTGTALIRGVNANASGLLSANLRTPSTPTADIGVLGTGSFYGVFGVGGAKTGVYGTTTGEYGIHGRTTGTTSTAGVYGEGGSGIGVDATSSYIAVRATASGTGTALYVAGPMQITNTAVVTNLNADKVDGKDASAFVEVAAGTTNAKYLYFVNNNTAPSNTTTMAAWIKLSTNDGAVVWVPGYI